MNYKLFGIMIFTMIFGFTLSASAQQKVAHFGLAYLESFQTTELGEDEIYLVVSGHWKNGQQFNFRYPNATGHWDLNDGEGDPALENQPLIDFTMENGQAVDFTVMVMEEDGGSTGEWISRIPFGIFDEKRTSVLSKILSFVPNITDTDDFIGAFSVHIENYNGDIYTQFAPRDRVYNCSDPSLYWLSFNVDMNGDGSNYKSQFYVRR